MPIRTIAWIFLLSWLPFVGSCASLDKVAKKPPAPAQTSPSATATNAAATATATTAAALEKESEAGIRCAGARCEVSKAYFDAFLRRVTNPPWLFRLTPVSSNGNPIGFRMTSIQPESDVAKFGLKDADVLTRCNDVELKTPDNALEVANRLKTATVVNLGIERQDKPLTLTLVIRFPAANVLYQQGLAAGNSGYLAKAAELMQLALVADPKHFLAQFDLGGAYEELGRKDEAIDCYRQLTALRPDFAEAQGQLGTLYLLHRHDIAQAIETYKRAMLIKQPYVDPRFSIGHTRGQVLQNLAIAYAEQRRFGLVVGIVRSLLNDPTAEFNSKQVLRIGGLAKGDLEEALAREFAAELDSIRSQLYSGQAAAALRRYEAFAAAHPADGLRAFDRWDLFSGLGAGRALTGKLAEAAPAFAQAAQTAEELRYGQWQESMWNLACAYAESGQPTLAIGALEPVLFVDLLTKYDPERVKKGPYRPKIATDTSLQSIRNHPALIALLATYPD